MLRFSNAFFLICSIFCKDYSKSALKAISVIISSQIGKIFTERVNILMLEFETAHKGPLIGSNFSKIIGN